MSKLVYQIDGEGYFLGATVADESPREPGRYLVPANCVEAEPPEPPAGKLLRWTGAAWALEAIPVEVEEVPAAPTVEELAAEARAQRNGLLALSDWTQMPDAPLSDTVRAAWAAYRQALRDLPEQPGWPAAITWPTAPAV